MGLRRRCLICSQLLAPGCCIVCQRCDLALPRLYPSRQCRYCAGACVRGQRWCYTCRLQRPSRPFVNLYAAFVYRDSLPRAVALCKYGGHLPLWHWLLRRWWAYVERVDWPKYDAILAVPRHPLKVLWRDFDAVHLMVDLLAKRTGGPYARVCRRSFFKRIGQVGLPARARWRGIRACYSITESLLGQHILIVDDVVTTSATVSAIAHHCRRQGARSIDVLCLARRPVSGFEVGDKR